MGARDKDCKFLDSEFREKLVSPDSPEFWRILGVFEKEQELKGKPCFNNASHQLIVIEGPEKFLFDEKGKILRYSNLSEFYW